MIFTALQEEVLMKQVLDTYSSKNDINIKQIVDPLLIEEVTFENGKRLFNI